MSAAVAAVTECTVPVKSAPRAGNADCVPTAFLGLLYRDSQLNTLPRRGDCPRGVATAGRTWWPRRPILTQRPGKQAERTYTAGEWTVA